MLKHNTYFDGNVLAIKLAGSSEWKTYPAGTIFEVAGKSGFDVRATSPSAYLCEFL